jgi:hypothetical protein
LDVRILLGLVSLMPLAPAHIGSGDAVQPRDTMSVIESIVPALPEGISLSIVGSDTYVRVETNGVSVEVPGYEGEPYLQIDSNGVVQVNDGSVTTLLNSERYGNVNYSSFEASSTPLWRTISTDGIAMWHDHRSHWMSPLKPAVIDDKGTVQPFVIPLVVNGENVTVNGTLYLRDKASVAWWLFGFGALLIAVGLSIAQRKAFFAVVAVVSFLGAMVGALEYYGLPHGARITPVLVLFSAAACVIAVASLARRFQKNGALVAISLNAGAGATLIVTAWLCIDQVRAAYVPGLDNPWLARIVIPVMFGVGIVCVVDGIIRIAFPGQPQKA